MSGEKNPALWQQVSKLRPRLRRHIRVLPQNFRQERWYVLHDETSGQFLRFNSAAYELVGRFNGDLSIGEIVDTINEHQVEDHEIATDDILVILAQLHEFEALQGGLPFSAQDALRRYRQSQKSDFFKQWKNPLSIRLRVLDPDPLLNKLQLPARWIFSRSGFCLWLTVVFFGVVLALMNVDEISLDLADKATSTSSLLMLIFLYPLVKIVHEFGHGLAVKTWGGEVHEAGIIFLIFFPVPYVDASAAWAFQDKRKRIVVSAAGIMVELFLASFGVLIWCLTQPGTLNSLALDLAIVAGVSTLLYNGNPLLRFDGYYVLEDLLEIPNLGSRSSRYYVYLVQRYLLGISDARSPVTANGEVFWFIVYGFMSPVYRLMVLLGIAIYLSGKYLIVGVVLAAWAVTMQVLKPVYASIRFLIFSSRLEYKRTQGITAVALGALMLFLILNIQVPLVTRSQGVVWTADGGQINATLGGEITRVVTETGDAVASGDILITMKNREMENQLIVLRARLVELKAIEALERQVNRVSGEIAQSNVRAIEMELLERERQFEALNVRSPVSGILVFNDPHIMAGKYIHTGDTLAYVVQPDLPVVRAVVDQNSIGSFGVGVTEAEVVLADQLGTVVKASVVRAVPAGGSRLPSRAMGIPGGGPIPVVASDLSGLSAENQVFQYDLTLPAGTYTAGLGVRAYVRLTHGTERLWLQFSRNLQQLFLSRLGV